MTPRADAAAPHGRPRSDRVLFARSRAARSPYAHVSRPQTQPQLHRHRPTPRTRATNLPPPVEQSNVSHGRRRRDAAVDADTVDSVGQHRNQQIRSVGQQVVDTAAAAAVVVDDMGGQNSAAAAAARLPSAESPAAGGRPPSAVPPVVGGGGDRGGARINGQPGQQFGVVSNHRGAGGNAVPQRNGRQPGVSTCLYIS